MKINMDIELTCEVECETGWYGYRFKPGFFYKNSFYNSTWFHREKYELNDFDNLRLAHDVRDAYNDLVSDYHIIPLYFKDMEECELKKILLDLMKQAYTDYIL